MESTIIDALRKHGNLRQGELYEQVYGTPARQATVGTWNDLSAALEQLVAHGRVRRHEDRFGSNVMYSIV